MPTDVLRLADVDSAPFAKLLGRFGLRLQVCPSGEPLPASYWGECEAGLKGNRLFAREDTPLHSILHEACHFICMDTGRRRRLDTDAGSDEAEENAVCFLQILLADELDALGRQRMFTDMDRWGYSFRLGSSRAWFEQDADDALAWLLGQNLLDENHRPHYRLRGNPLPPDKFGSE